jgi:putative membrane protein
MPPGLIIAILLVLLGIFAVANRQAISLSLDPLPFAIDLPLYLLVFLVFAAGLVLGMLAQWLLRVRPAAAKPTAGAVTKA